MLPPEQLFWAIRQGTPSFLFVVVRLFSDRTASRRPAADAGSGTSQTPSTPGCARDLFFDQLEPPMNKVR